MSKTGLSCVWAPVHRYKGRVCSPLPSKRRTAEEGHAAELEAGWPRKAPEASTDIPGLVETDSLPEATGHQRVNDSPRLLPGVLMLSRLPSYKPVGVQLSVLQIPSTQTSAGLTEVVHVGFIYR